MLELEKMSKILQWIEDVNIDIIEDEVIPGVSVEEFDKIKSFFANKENIEKLKKIS